MLLLCCLRVEVWEVGRTCDTLPAPLSLNSSNAKQLWVVPPMSDEELLLTQAALLKAANPNIKVFVYR